MWANERDLRCAYFAGAHFYVESLEFSPIGICGGQIMGPKAKPGQAIIGRASGTKKDEVGSTQANQGFLHQSYNAKRTLVAFALAKPQRDIIARMAAEIASVVYRDRNNERSAARNCMPLGYIE